MHAEVLSSGQTTFAQCAYEAVDVVDVLTRIHDQLVGTDWTQASRTQMRRE